MKSVDWDSKAVDLEKAVWIVMVTHMGVFAVNEGKRQASAALRRERRVKR